MNSVDNLVSVIIPAYNAAPFLADTVNSVLNQEYRNIELIIVNDGSSDSTEEIVKQFLSNPVVKYIHQENQGCSGAKNSGLASASGGFIQFLDADDMLSADKIKEQVAVLDNEPMGVAICRTEIFEYSIGDVKDSEIDTEFLYDADNSLEFVLNLYGVNGRNGMIQPNAFLISSKLANQIGPYDISLSPAPDEDGEYFCRAMLAADKIHYTRKGINYYRKLPKSQSSLSRQVSERSARGALVSLQLITKHLLSRENSIRVKEAMAKYFSNYIYVYSQYTELVKAAETEINKLGFTKIPATGGENFRKMSKLLGFHNALIIKNLSFRLKKSKLID